ncbi:MAG: hypothetical protein ACR2NN_27980 [Bryobacteraceae bacterium]
MFARFQISQRYRSGSGSQGNDLKPGGSMGNPAARRQDIRLADQDQIAKWGAVGDYDARHGSDAEPVVSLPSVFEILPGVFEPDLMLL